MTVRCSCTHCEVSLCCFARIWIPGALTAAKGSRIGEDKVACVKRGVVMPEDHCGAFKYDPLKRVPPRPMKLDTDKLREEDFQL